MTLVSKVRKKGKGLPLPVFFFLLGILLAPAVPSAVPASGSAGTGDPATDPFEPPSLRPPVRQSGAGPGSRNPLETFPPGDLRLLGTARSAERQVALVRGPDGKFYILSRGDRVGPGGGRVTNLSDRRVVIEETAGGPPGEGRKNRFVLDLDGEKETGETP